MSNVQSTLNVEALMGVEPETLAYGMAKYSRSALPIRESLAEITSQKASAFLDKFYFNYGHRSIADMAHIPLAIENVSLLAAIEIVDEQRWDGQERSTRYQDFSKRLYYTPPDLDELEAIHYKRTIGKHFDLYDEVFRKTLDYFSQHYPKPNDMEQAAYERTLRARSFDVARYHLPLATLTSLGQITSARTLESQISRLLTVDNREVNQVAQAMKEAATADGSAPTLLKYADENVYAAKVDGYMQWLVSTLDIEPRKETDQRPIVDAFVPTDMQGEIIATLLYQNSNHRFRDLYSFVMNVATDAWRSKVLHEIARYRGPHDELHRAYRTGGIVFDIYIDIGGYRDLHRHRRTNQFSQPFQLGDFAVPEPITDQASFLAMKSHTQTAVKLMADIEVSNGNHRSSGAYLLPLATKRGLLMKMDVAEAAYIAELRTGPAGHISYRRAAWEIFLALNRIAPNVANSIRARVTDPNQPVDFFKR